MSEQNAGAMSDEEWHISPRPVDEGYKIVSNPGTNPADGDEAGMEWIATVFDGDSRGPGPNARLIASAPQLRRALDARTQERDEARRELAAERERRKSAEEELNKLRRLLMEAGICSSCEQEIVHYIDEPLASCGCVGGQGEWTSPPPKIQTLRIELAAERGRREY